MSSHIGKNKSGQPKVDRSQRFHVVVEIKPSGAAPPRPSNGSWTMTPSRILFTPRRFRFRPRFLWVPAPWWHCSPSASGKRSPLP